MDVAQIVAHEPTSATMLGKVPWIMLCRARVVEGQHNGTGLAAGWLLRGHPPGAHTARAGTVPSHTWRTAWASW